MAKAIGGVSNVVWERKTYEVEKLSWKEKIRNIFLSIVTLGFHTYHKTMELEKALYKGDLTAAKKAIHEGAARNINARQFHHLVETKQVDSLNFIFRQMELTWDDDDFSLIEKDLYGKFKKGAADFLPLLKIYLTCRQPYDTRISEKPTEQESKLFYSRVGSIFQEALENKNHDVLKTICSTNSFNKSGIIDSYNFHKIFHYRSFDELKCWIEDVGLDVNIVDRNDWKMTIVCEAVKKNDLVSAEYLLKKGADSNVCFNNFDQEGIVGTPLNFAVSMNNVQMVKLLLKYKADPYLKQPHSHHGPTYSAVETIIKRRLVNVEILKLFINSGKLHEDDKKSLETLLQFAEETKK